MYNESEVAVINYDEESRLLISGLLSHFEQKIAKTLLLCGKNRLKLSNSMKHLLI